MAYKRSRGKTCAVIGCNNSNKLLYDWKQAVCTLHGEKHMDCPCLIPFKMYSFPKDDQLKHEWLRKLSRKDYTPGKVAVVCSKHFLDGKPTGKNPAPQLLLGHMSEPKEGIRNYKLVRKLYEANYKLPKTNTVQPVSGTVSPSEEADELPEELQQDINTNEEELHCPSCTCRLCAATLPKATYIDQYVGKRMQDENNVEKMNLRVSICKTCVDFKRKSDIYERKCEDYKWKLAEFEIEISEKDKLLQEYKKQIRDLEERLRRKANSDEKIGIDEVMDGCGEWDVVVPKIEPPDVSEDLLEDSYSPLTKAMEPKMEPEVVLKEGEDDDGPDDENDSPPPNTANDHRKSNKRTTNTNVQQTFYQICRWTTKDTNGTPKACLKVHSVCELTTHISKVHTHWKDNATHKCFWENCAEDTEFKSRSDLIQHVGCHLLQARYRCDVEDCGEEFIHESHLERHMFSHRCKRTSDKRYKCPYGDCERTFGNAMILRHHIVTHTTEKVRVPNAANLTQDTGYKTMATCSVAGCASTTESGDVSLHCFPKDEALRNIWQVRLKLDKSLGAPRVCHKHFLPTDFFKYNMQAYGDRRRLRVGVVPSQYLPV